MEDLPESGRLNGDEGSHGPTLKPFHWPPDGPLSLGLELSHVLTRPPTMRGRMVINVKGDHVTYPASSISIAPHGSQDKARFLIWVNTQTFPF